MNENAQFNFLDILTIISVALQMQDHITSVTKQDFITLNQKLDRLLQLAEGNNRDADMHP